MTTYEELYNSSIIAHMVEWDNMINPTNDKQKAGDCVHEHLKTIKKYTKENPECVISEFNRPLLIDDGLQEKLTCTKTKVFQKYSSMKESKSSPDDEYFDAFDEMVNAYREVLKSKGENATPISLTDGHIGSSNQIIEVVKELAKISKDAIDSGNTAKDPYYPYEGTTDEYIKAFDDVIPLISEDRGSFMIPIDKINSHIHVCKRSDDFLVNSSTFHEMGHALYQNRILSKHTTIGEIGQHISLSLHESSAIFNEITLSGLRTKVENNDQRNKFRIGSNKLHYIIHVYIRMEIENILLSGEMTARDIPEMWNGMIKEYMGLTVENDWEGFLQDVHWNGVGFGYFHSYAIGFFNAACMFQDIRADVSGDKISDTVDVILPHIEKVYGRFNERDHDLLNKIHPDMDASMQKYRRFVEDVFTV